MHLIIMHMHPLVIASIDTDPAMIRRRSHSDTSLTLSRIQLPVSKSDAQHPLSCSCVFDHAPMQLEAAGRAMRSDGGGAERAQNPAARREHVRRLP